MVIANYWLAVSPLPPELNSDQSLNAGNIICSEAIKRFQESHWRNKNQNASSAKLVFMKLVMEHNYCLDCRALQMVGEGTKILLIFPPTAKALYLIDLQFFP